MRSKERIIWLLVVVVCILFIFLNNHENEPSKKITPNMLTEQIPSENTNLSTNLTPKLNDKTDLPTKEPTTIKELVDDVIKLTPNTKESNNDLINPNKYTQSSQVTNNNSNSDKPSASEHTLTILPEETFQEVDSNKVIFELSLDDLLIENHHNALNEPFFYYNLETLFLSENSPPEINVFNSVNTGNFTFLKFKDITYITTGEVTEEDFQTEKPFMMILTSNKYSLTSGLSVGDKKTKIMEKYLSIETFESLEYENIPVFPFVSDLFQFDEFIHVQGLFEPCDKYPTMPGPHIYGLGFYIKDDTIIGICNTFPTAN